MVRATGVHFAGIGPRRRDNGMDPFPRQGLPMSRLLALALICFGPTLAVCGEPKGDAKSVKQLTAALRSDNAVVRYKAVLGLGELGVEAAPAVKDLARLLSDPQPAVRRAVAQVLGQLGDDAAPAVPSLARALRDRDPGVRELAGAALSAVGDKAAPALLAMLQDAESSKRVLAILAIDGVRLKSDQVVKALSKATKDTSADVRRVALFVLAKMDVEPDQILPILRAALGDKDAATRKAAVTALLDLGKDATDELGKAATGGPPTARLLAVQALASLGTELDEKGAAALSKALADGDIRVRRTAALALAKLGPLLREVGGKELLPTLTKLLQDRDASLRRAAAMALVQYEAESATELATLAKGLKDTDAIVRGMIVERIARSSNETAPDELRDQVVTHLVAALRDADRRVQFVAARALVEEAGRAVEPLTKVIMSGAVSQRVWAAIVLGEIGAAAADAAPALQKMARDTNPQARQAALTALRKIMP